MKQLAGLIALLGSTIFPAFAHAQVDPDLEWRQAKIGSFVLIYDAQHQELAELYASRLQRLEKEIQPLWPIVPSKTTVVLNDRTDLTNGYATFLPYPLIMLYPVLPTTQDSIGEYDDWAWELLVHEYTHILSFEQRRGYSWGLSYLFGSILTPNVLLPSWSLEGVAVESETRYSRAGRLRSDMQAGTLRAMELEETLSHFRYNEINEATIPTWPYGSRPYLFGSLMWSEMATMKGPKTAGEFHYRLGGRLPYLLETPFQETFDGLNQKEIFDRVIGNVQGQIQSQVKELKKIEFTATAPLDPDMIESQSPALSADGLKLAYIAKSDTLKRKIQIWVRPKKEEPWGPQHRRKQFGKDEDLSSVTSGGGSPIPRIQEGPPGGNINRLDWHPDSEQVVYDQVSEKNRFHEYSNLWIYNLKKAKADRITTDGRAREPAFSPDGNQIAYILLEAGRTHLAIFDLASKKSTTLVNNSGQTRASQPIWLNENEILFTQHEQGEEKALIRNLKTQETRRVLADFKNPESFSIQRNESKIIFTSTKNGVRNAYETDLQLANPRPVTHSGSYVTNAVYDAGTRKYLATQISSKGNQIVSFEATEKNRLPENLPVIGPLWPERYPAATTTSEEKMALGEIAEKYSPWNYLWPHYWLPFVSFGPDGFLGSVLTSGQDPLERHSYSLNALYDSAINRASVLASYSNHSYYPINSLSYYDVYTRLADPTLVARTQVGQLSSSWEIESLSPDLFVSLGATAIHREKFGFESDQAGPFLGVAYTNITRSGYQISPEAGYQTTLVLSSKEDRTLARRNSSAEGTLTNYFSTWLPKHHAIMTKLSGRYTDEVLRVESLDSSSSDLSTSATPVGNYLMRGYPTGTFLGKTIAAATLEYRFPFNRLDRGPDLYPFYLHQAYGAVVADGILFDGYVYNAKFDPKIFQRVEWGYGFANVGIEAKFEADVGYHIPMTLVTGLYWPLNSKIANPEPLWGLGIQL